MTEVATSQPGAKQMTDEEIQLEAARGRMIGLVSVLTVAMFSGFILTSWLAIRDTSRADQAKYLLAIDDHKLAFVFSGFFLSVASLLVAGVLVHVILAARSRSQLVPRLALYLAIAGPVIVALAFPAYVLAQVSAAGDFAGGASKTVETAKELSDSGLLQVTAYVYYLGNLLLAVAWIMSGIYGMRIGLLTRLVGAVAIAIGLANVIAPPFAALLSVFWIGAFAIMLLSDGNQVPPAWKLGRPVPWSEVAAMGQAQQEDPADFDKPDPPVA